MRLKNASGRSPPMETSARVRWSGLLWLVPVLSVGDVLWAIGAKAGLPITFGLGLYKWEMLHVIIQVALVVLLSLYFVASSPTGEEVLVVEGADVTGPEEGRRE